MNKRFTEEQILGFLCEADMGVPVRQLCSKHGFSERSYYQWRARIVAGKPSLAQRLAELETENAQLKQLLADAMLDTTPPRPTASRAARSATRPVRLPFAPLAQRMEPAHLQDEPLEWPELLPESGALTH
jgi:putative transposase